MKVGTQLFEMVVWLFSQTNRGLLGKSLEAQTTRVSNVMANIHDHSHVYLCRMKGRGRISMHNVRAQSAQTPKWPSLGTPSGINWNSLSPPSGIDGSGKLTTIGQGPNLPPESGASFYPFIELFRP